MCESGESGMLVLEMRKMFCIRFLQNVHIWDASWRGMLWSPVGIALAMGRDLTMMENY